MNTSVNRDADKAEDFKPHVNPQSPENSPSATSTTVGTDLGEPRTGYRPELDEQTDRFEQYGMVRGAGSSNVSQPRSDAQGNYAPKGPPQPDHATEDAFESEFKSRQSDTRAGEPDGRGAMWGVNGDDGETDAPLVVHNAHYEKWRQHQQRLED